jgi:hypothetical protein
MLFICRCAVCSAVTEGQLESMSRIELDFIDQTIRFVCPECKKESEMSILTSNKKKSAPYPSMIVTRSGS